MLHSTLLSCPYCKKITNKTYTDDAFEDNSVVPKKKYYVRTSTVANCLSVMRVNSSASTPLLELSNFALLLLSYSY